MARGTVVTPEDLERRQQFCEWLRETARERGVSTMDIAKATGISPTTVDQWLRGKRFPSVEVYQRLARAIQVDVDEFFVRAGYRDPINDGILAARMVDQVRQINWEDARQTSTYTGLMAMFEAIIAMQKGPQPLRIVTDEDARARG